MVYQTTKPAPNDDLDVSVTDIQQNFLTANTVMDINHYPFNDLTANKGKHKFVTFVSQTPPATLSSELALYSKFVPGDGVCLFLTRDNSTVFDVQLTTDKIIQPLGSTNGYTFLPGGLSGGILFQWGMVSLPGSSGSVSFPVAFPNNCWNVQLTQRRDASNSAQGMFLNGAPSASGFNYNGSSSTSEALFWTAIGN